MSDPVLKEAYNIHSMMNEGPHLVSLGQVEHFIARAGPSLSFVEPWSTLCKPTTACQSLEAHPG